MIGALGDGKLALFLKGINLDEFPAYVARFPLLVSYNGSQFDVPFLRAHFPRARLDQAHIDLRFVLASLGYKGGLKAVEGRLGLRRDPSIQGVDGFEAVRLWHRYRRGDKIGTREIDPLQRDRRGEPGRARRHRGGAEARPPLLPRS